jgi:hypothetical protein
MFMVQVGLNGFWAPRSSRLSKEYPSPIESLARVIAQGQKERSVTQGSRLSMSVGYWAAIQGLCCYAATGMTVSPAQKTLNRILLREDHL